MGKEATHRLEDMTTQEVSLVERGANLRDFILRKAKKNQNMPAPAKTKKEALELPTEARNTFLKGVSDALEKLTGVTQALKESTIADSAEVPDELPRMLLETAELLAKVASQYLATGDDKTDADKPTTDEAEKANAFLNAIGKARRMTNSREEQLKAIAAAFVAFGSSMGVELTVEATVADETAKSKLEQLLLDKLESMDGRLNELSASAKNTEKSAAKPTRTIEELAQEIETLKAAAGTPVESNSHGAEGADETTQKSDVHEWPQDLAASVAAKQAAAAK